MRREKLIIPVLLGVLLLLNGIPAFADAADDGILTLEEAKELALKNDVKYNLQQSYIQDAIENYNEVIENNSGNVGGRYSNIADKAAAEISQDIAIENAAISLRKAIFNKEDMKRSSDYEVTNAFYDVIKAEYSLENAEADLESKKNDLETAKIKYELNITAKSSYSQAEAAYETSKAAYDKALSDLKTSRLQLGKSIGEDLNALNVRLDKTFKVPDIGSIDLDKIKKGYPEKNSAYLSAKEQYKLAEYKLALTEEEYDYYFEKLKNMSSSVQEKFDDMLYDAQEEFNDAEYSYNEKLDELDETLESQYNSLKDQYKSYEEQKAELDEARLEAQENEIKYQMGLIKKSELDSSIANVAKLEKRLNTTIMNINIQYMNIMQYSSDK